MNEKSNLTFKGWSVVLAIALMAPFAVNLVHHFSHEKHDHCTETGVTHFHEEALDCELCDYQITPVASYLSFEFVKVNIDKYTNPLANYTINPYLPPVGNSFLRGPPVEFIKNLT